MGKRTYLYRNHDIHQIEKSQGCVRCGQNDPDELVIQRVIPRTFLVHIPEDMNGARRCFVVCKSCIRKYSSDTYPLEMSLNASDIGSPRDMLLTWVEFLLQFTDRERLPRRWNALYDDLKARAD